MGLAPESTLLSSLWPLAPKGPPLRFRHFGERFGLVLAGSVRLTLNGDPHELGIGEYLHYGSHEEHTIEVTSESDPTVLWIVSPAIF